MISKHFFQIFRYTMLSSISLSFQAANQVLHSKGNFHTVFFSYFRHGYNLLKFLESWKIHTILTFHMGNFWGNISFLKNNIFPELEIFLMLQVNIFPCICETELKKRRCGRTWGALKFHILYNRKVEFSSRMGGIKLYHRKIRECIFNKVRPIHRKFKMYISELNFHLEIPISEKMNDKKCRLMSHNCTV